MAKKENKFRAFTDILGNYTLEGETPTLLGAKRLAGKHTNLNDVIYRIEDCDKNGKPCADAIERWACYYTNRWTHELQLNGVWGRAGLESNINHTIKTIKKCEVFLVDKEALNDYRDYFDSLTAESKIRRRLPQKGSITYVGSNFDEVVEYCRAHPQYSNSLLNKNGIADNRAISCYYYFEPKLGALYFVEVK